MKTAILLLFLLINSFFGKSEQSWINTRISSTVTVSFPSKPEHQWSKKETLYAYATDQVSLTVSVKALSEHLELTPNNQRSILEGAVHGFSKNQGTVLYSNTDIILGTTPVKEIHFQVKHPMHTSCTTGYTRYFVSGRALYTIQCFFLVMKNEQGEQVKNLFFNSINISM
ncbi:hypothetical protein WG947_09325 [Pontibacter sp. H259]|uniref:hypothetical protein n=1 Tax=Pontibacter sp. H259 TaxID=3133421 RepID=UPI0030C09785